MLLLENNVRSTSSLCRFAGLMGLCVVVVLPGCAPVLPMHSTIRVVADPAQARQSYIAQDHWCNDIARNAVQNDPGPQAIAGQTNDSSATTIVDGAVIGALAGSLAGRVGVGALAGLALGAVVGSAMASGGAQVITARMQSVYNASYVQCMAYYHNYPVYSVYPG